MEEQKDYRDIGYSILIGKTILNEFMKSINKDVNELKEKLEYEKGI